MKVFISYSHKDEPLKDELEVHLSILKRQSLIEIWHDRRILPGKGWEKEINENLATADLVLLLVSPDFIASQYCYGMELQRALERHDTKQCIVIPVIVRPIDWTEENFAKIQALPKDALPVTSWSNRDEAWLDVAKGIRAALEDLRHLRDRKQHSNGLMRVDQLLKENMRKLEQVYEEKSTCSGGSTGFTEFDASIDGLHPGDLVVFAARPEMGKTDILINIAISLGAYGDCPVGFFSMKYPSDHVIKKLMCAEGKVSFIDYSRGWLRDDDWPKLARAAGMLYDSKIYIDDSRSPTYIEISQRISAFASQNGGGVIIIDTLQHLVPPEDTETGISQLCRALKELARECKVTIICSSQVSMKCESRLDKRPTLLDLEKWSCIIDDADVIALMYFDEYYDRYTERPGIVELILVKNGKGPLTTIDLKYQRDSAHFERACREAQHKADNKRKQGGKYDDICQPAISQGADLSGGAP